MDAIMSRLQESCRGKAARRPVVVAVSEDSSTDARIQEFCRSLAQQLGMPVEVRQQVWLLSELRVPQLRAIAADEAAQADLIIVSVHHAERLPSEVESWIELWLSQKRIRSAALLALFDPVYQGVSSSMQAYLRGVAQKARVEFLVQSDDTPRER
jgi:hypothetical protein